MAPTEAQRRARDKWLTEKVETINLRVPKGKKTVFKEHAKARGESVNAFLLRAAEETMARDEVSEPVDED